MAEIPCPPGFLWPRGRVWGVDVPSLFVDYAHTNDFFFSGHTGTALILGLEFFQLDYNRLAWFYACFVTPYVAVMVVSFRVHRGIDVLAAVLAAVTSCSVSKELGDSVDRWLQIKRRSSNNKAG